MSETRPDFDHDPTKASTVRVVRKSSLPDSQEGESEVWEFIKGLAKARVHPDDSDRVSDDETDMRRYEFVDWAQNFARHLLATRPEPTDVREALEASLGARATAYARGEE